MISETTAGERMTEPQTLTAQIPVTLGEWNQDRWGIGDFLEAQFRHEARRRGLQLIGRPTMLLVNHDLPLDHPKRTAPTHVAGKALEAMVDRFGKLFVRIQAKARPG